MKISLRVLPIVPRSRKLQADKQSIQKTKAISPKNARSYRILLVLILVILSVQAWFGDFVNIFVAPPTGVTPPPFSLTGLLQGIESLGLPLIWHAFEGFSLVVIGLALAILSFVWSCPKGAKISSFLGFIFIVVAALGGVLFVLSGFSDGGASMQMGGSFVGAFAMYFVALYFSK